jgi:hypothetical protein
MIKPRLNQRPAEISVFAQSRPAADRQGNSHKCPLQTANASHVSIVVKVSVRMQYN